MSGNYQIWLCLPSNLINLYEGIALCLLTVSLPVYFNSDDSTKDEAVPQKGSSWNAGYAFVSTTMRLYFAYIILGKIWVDYVCGIIQSFGLSFIVNIGNGKNGKVSWKRKMQEYNERLDKGAITG